jgi:4-amino-4-deoxy-L-arabinose transferase-like glycosyltransferase
LLIVTSLDGAIDLTHIDEHRYAEVSRAMAVPGGDWLVPHLNGAIYPDKPPLFFWAAAALQRLGVPLPGAAVVPSLFGTALALLATFGIARRLLGTPAAVAAVVVLATAVRFADFAGRANLDAFLTGFVALSIYAAVRGDAAERGTARSSWYAIGCLGAGAGILVKGPLALAIPAVAVAGGRFLEGRGRSLVSPWTLAALMVALLPIAVWLVASGLHVGWEYPQRIVGRHALEHAFGRVNHAGQPWDYLRIFPEAFLPGMLLLPAALVGIRWQRPFRPGDALPLAWFVGGLLLLSALPVERHHYLMPLYPGAALLVAGLFRRDAMPVARRSIVGFLAATGRVAIATLGAALGLVALIAAVLVAAGVDPAAAMGAGANAEAIWRLVATAPPSVLGLGVVVATFLVAAACAVAVARSERTRALAMAGIVLAVTIANARLVVPVIETARGRLGFFEAITAQVGEGAIADYGRMHFAANWALGRDVVPVLGDPAAAERFLAAHPAGGAFLLADRESLDRQGMPAGARVLYAWPRPLDSDLVLIGN